MRSTPMGSPAGSPVSEDVRKRRLLVVDDEQAVLDLMRHVLQEAGFEVETAGGGRAAIDRIGAGRPDLVTLDLSMPDIDGWGVLAHLRRVPSPPPVVVITGHPESVGPVGVMSAVAGYVVKPFSPGDVLRTCKKILRAKEAQRPFRGEDRRVEKRRSFVVGTKVLSPEGAVLGSGHVVEVSPHGVRVDLDVPLSYEQVVKLVFRIPGHPTPLEPRGEVRWNAAGLSGLRFVELGDAEGQSLRDLAYPMGQSRN